MQSYVNSNSILTCIVNLLFENQFRLFWYLKEKINLQIVFQTEKFWPAKLRLASIYQHLELNGRTIVKVFLRHQCHFRQTQVIRYLHARRVSNIVTHAFFTDEDMRSGWCFKHCALYFMDRHIKSRWHIFATCFKKSMTLSSLKSHWTTKRSKDTKYFMTFQTDE